MKPHTLLLFTSLTLAAHAVERWGVFEISLTGPASDRPYLDVQWSATFTQGERRITVPGFWDGGDTFKVRFSPPTAGEWRYETKSGAPALNGKTGAFTAVAPTGNNHGPVEAFNTFYLRYADGTPYHPFGTTCYAWVHQPHAMQEQTLKTLAASPFNKIRFCVFPKSYTYNKNEPEFFAFQKGANGKFDFNRPDPIFWRHFERRILELQKLGIEADLILWHPYDRWGFADMSDEEDDRYLRYCIARLSAFRNVWWSLANEYDFMTDRPQGHRGNKQWDDWDRFFAILQKEDPHQRLRGIHNGKRWYDHTKAWVTHASLQTADMNGGLRFRNQYRKPVIYDECRYEGNIPQGWGNLTAREMTQKFWLGTLSGCYVGHGETYQHPEDILWWAKGGVLHGESPQRIQWLKEFMAQAPPFHELQPLGDDKGRFVLAKPGEYYLAYCVNPRPQTVELAGQGPYRVDLIDPWAMTTSPVGTARSGAFAVTPPKADVAYRFTPYAAGEPLRPEARLEATPTEGIPPLTVAFKAITDAAQAEWDFGDGATATGLEVQHTFTQPGVYAVSVKVTDQRGGSAVAVGEVVTERDVTQPIVRAGFAADERPALKFHGTARRGTNGALVLPEGTPWGWVQAGDQPLADLRGLRSFTMLGWLKPDSLQMGSGGNRIVHFLNRDHSGVDLVCHTNGGLRLAVNQWPDSVRNDSSPGKLQVGKWTFFAVTYQAVTIGNNVSWYFSPPLDAPGATTLTLDRQTAHHAGPVGTDIGALVLGNFNDTMRGYGLDRQFRGEIRGLQIFGSRVGGRGALSLEAIQASIGPHGRASVIHDLTPLHDATRVLVNPHKGWYHHYPDNHPNNYKIARDADLLEFPGMDHLYIRLAWSYLEPKEGQFDWAVIDRIIDKWTAHGLGIAFRISCKETDTSRIEQQFATPRWVMQAGAKGGYYLMGKATGPEGPWEPIYDDPIFLAKLDKFLAAFAARYDGKPWLRYVDIGSIGDWGEGHSWAGSRKECGFAVRKAHVDLHLKHFKHAQLVVSNDLVYKLADLAQRQALHQYILTNGISYRDDSILVDGYLADTSKSFTVNSPHFFAAAFPATPTVLELGHYGGHVKRLGNWDGRPGSNVAKFGEGKKGPDYFRGALELLHATYIGYHGYAHEWLADNPELTKELLNKCGYWLFPKSVELPDKLVAGSTVPLKLTMENRGVAPPYAPYELRVKLAAGGTTLVRLHNS